MKNTRPKSSAKGRRLGERQLLEQLVADYAPLVSFIARDVAKTLPPSVDVDDLVAAGMLGLLDAIDKFDPARGAKFKTYGTWRIRGAILDELRRMDCLPRSARDKLKELDRARSRIEAHIRRRPSSEEIANAMGLDLATYHALTARLKAFEAGSKSSGGGEQRSSEPAPSTSSPAFDPAQALFQQDRREALALALETLPERERLTLCLYYYEGLTLKEIAKILGVTESRVSQLHGQALAALRRRRWDVKGGGDTP